MEAAQPGFRTEATAEGLRVVTLPPRNWAVVAVCLGFSAVTAVAVVDFAVDLLRPHGGWGLFPGVLWLGAFGGVSLLALSTALWHATGREIIVLNASVLTWRVELLVLSRTRSFPMTEITYLRPYLADDRQHSHRGNIPIPVPPLLGTGKGRIAFEYRGKTWRAGALLTKDEAKTLLPLLIAQLPRTAPR